MLPHSQAQYGWQGRSGSQQQLASCYCSDQLPRCSCVERAMAADAHWGILFFHYDWFAAFRTDVVRHVRFDPFIHHYKSDCGARASRSPAELDA